VEQNRLKQVQQEHQRAQAMKQSGTQSSTVNSPAGNTTGNGNGGRVIGTGTAGGGEGAGRQGWINNEAQQVVDEWGERIRMYKYESAGVPPGLKCILGVTVLPDGNIQVRLVRGSGNTVHDESAIKAAYKAQPLPLPADPAVRQKARYFELGVESGLEGE
jgi:hypothetical protein